LILPAPNPVHIGDVTLDAPFYQAGLAGYSDSAMRMIARQHGCPYAVTEAMLDIFLIQGGKGLKEAELDSDDHPICGQLMGSHPREIAQAAKILVGLGYDVIDVNLACPVKKIKKRARGGHLLSVPEEAIEILDAVKQAIGDDRPLTCKLRRGYDDTAEHTANFHKVFTAAIELGYAGATVHGRTVEQKYLGPSRWSFLKNLVDEYGLRRNQLTIEDRQSEMASGGFCLGGSGDIWQARDIFRMLEETGIHLVSVARGCIGNPWIFKQARAYMAGDQSAIDRPPTVFEQRDVLYEHFKLSVGLHGEKRASMMMRKFGIKFAQHHPRKDEIKKAFIAVRSLSEWEQVLITEYATDGPGHRVEIEEEAASVADSCEPVGSDDR